jgi:type III secretory pathway lipoprotein EscJ
MSDPQVVAVVGSRTEAELMVGMLRSRGLNAALSADDAGSVDLAIQQSNGVRVLVAAPDAAEARALLQAQGRPSSTLNPLQKLLVRVLRGRATG